MSKSRFVLVRPNRALVLLGCGFVAASLTTPANAQHTTRVSVDSSGVEGDKRSQDSSVSDDGRFVAFWSDATNLVSGDTNGVADVFVHDRATGTTERVSVHSSGAAGDDSSFGPSISADGTIVAFWSWASTLVDSDTNVAADVFVHDRTTGTTVRVSVDSTGKAGNKDSANPSISADGQIVAFNSLSSNLVLPDIDSNGANDVFVHDRSTGITERVSEDSSGVPASTHCILPSISADGQLVAFASAADNLVAGDGNFSFDVFVHDRSTAVTERVSVDSSGAEGDLGSTDPSISADGRFVAFESTATNLVAGDTNSFQDVFVRDRSTGVTERVSVDSAGAEGDSPSADAAISEDGRFVAFESSATDLIASDTNGADDVFLRDRSAGATERVSVDSSGAEGDLGGLNPSISADSQVVAFFSFATDLVTGDTNGTEDVFVRERCDAFWLNYGAGFPGTNGVPSLTAQTDPLLGTTLTIDLANSSGVASIGVLFIRLQRTQIPTNKGGDLLVVPALTLFLPIPAAGLPISGALPDDDSLCGLEVDVQAIEVDAGAAKKLSFTPGLALILGR